MENIKLHNNDRKFTGASLLRLAVNIASHPALAAYTPAGPGALATGQGGEIRRGGRPGPGARMARARASHAAYSGPAAELGCHGCG